MLVVPLIFISYDRMGSYYQPKSYFTGGGKNRTRKQRGGFIPSVMGGVVSYGTALLTSSLALGMRLLRNEKKRMATRKSKAGARRSRR